MKAPAVHDAPPAPPPAPKPPAPPPAPDPQAPPPASKPPPPGPSFHERLSALSARLDDLEVLQAEDTRAHDLADSLAKPIREALQDLRRDGVAQEDRSLAEKCICRFGVSLSRPNIRPEESDVAWELSNALDAIDPDQPLIVELRVKALHRRQHYQEVLDLEKRIAKYPELVSDTHVFRAYAFASLGAEADAQREFGLTGGMPADKDDLQRILSNLVACHELCKESTRLSRAGRNKEALDAINGAIRKRDREGEPYLLRGVIREQLGDNDGAYRDYTTCYATRCPAAPDAICNRGHLDSKDPEKELEDYNRALTLDPEYDTAYRNRAVTRLKLRKDLDKALVDVDRAEKFGQGRSWLKDIPSLREEIKRAMREAR